MVIIMKQFDIAIIGGDKRTACMTSVFTEKGYNVISYGTLKHFTDNRVCQANSLPEALRKASVIVFGIPFAKNGLLYFEENATQISLAELQRMLRKHHKIFGGVISEDFKKVCAKRDIGCFDFMEDEPLTIFNAIATAEGAILEALLHKNTQLHHSQVLVLGYGRCGKILADKLKGLSAHVTVSARNLQELALASALGFECLPLSDMPQELNRFEYIFQTIPATILNKSCLEQLRKSTLIVDIASNQIGVDYEAAALLNRNVIFCPGLPGKYASQSCAEQLCEFVIHKI